MGGARDAAMEAVQGDGAAAAREAHRPGHLGDGADAGVLALVHGHEEDALLVAGLDREGDGHVREDDRVFQGDQQQVRHGLGSFVLRFNRHISRFNRHINFND